MKISDKKLLTLNRLNLKVVVPRIPNYILTEKENFNFNIEDLSDTALDFIADNWKLQLIEITKKRRKNK